uniref:Gypsy retrotransposon integrase-like protein 1 n=1 Tax=Astyanax mexicanus TaxID=7994 RepID=A0A3B1ISF7_ASTMX
PSLAKLHEGHQGVVKCRERARQSVWWPGLSQQLNELVLNCRTCIKERTNHTEPLIPTDLPERPWQKLGTDLFTLKGKTYLLVVDYYSRYVEVVNLSLTKSVDITLHLKSIFARHGIPEVVVSDNGPQYSSSIFSEFAATYGFKHITSSPRFPRSNGEAERAVQTVKHLLKKTSDPYLALLVYRATPLRNGYSPAQLLMGRQLRTTVPTLPSVLNPSLPDNTEVRFKEREKRVADQMHFNQRHRVRNLSKLFPGKQVWVTDQKVTGTVLGEHSTPRSYMIEVPHGTVRRNRHHLIPMDETDSNSTTQNSSQVPAAVTPIQTQVTQTPCVKPELTIPRTRFGRLIVKPQKLDL